MSNSMYWVTTMIFSLVLFIMWVDEKTNVKNRTKADQAFSLMLAYGIFFCIQDMAWGLCDCNIIRGDTALFIASSVFHLAIVFTSFYCMKFFLCYLENYISYKKTCIHICLCVIVIQVMLVTANLFYPVLFRIEAGEYVAKTYRPLSFLNQYIVYSVSGIMTFSCIKKVDKKQKDKYKAVFLVAIIPLMTGVFQLYYIEAPFYSLGYFLECTIVHTFIITKERNELFQGRILDSIANSYYTMHLFDLDINKLEEYIEPEIITSIVKNRDNAQEAINSVMMATVTEEYKDAVKEFVDFSTLSDRLSGPNSVSLDFVGLYHGWTRATFISMEKDEQGKLKKAMFTTQIIDAQKKRELEMYAKSHIDQLTKLYNRRAYETDITELERDAKKIIYASIDINELKIVNDTLGHEAGDEVIVGAAACMKQCFGPYGKVYRTGGDEFAVILYASDAELACIKKDFEDTVHAWKGKLVDHLSVSCGYVSRKEFLNCTFSEIAKTADERMYQDKTAWYRTKGIDRRGQAAAHTALCKLYTKILKINLTTDSYSIVNMDTSEQTAEKGFAGTISGWLYGFGKSGQVHKDDLNDYFQKTDLAYLRAYFQSGKTSISIFYRRKYADDFKLVAMEMIPADDYTEDNQALFLYVKNIEI